jgi:predicted AlkP superfamily phosphohydrolase/phosphomutase
MSEHTPPPARLVVLGIDAASPELLERWIADGTLPNLAALARRGVAGGLRGIEGFFVGSTWPSMYTGSNPASHGVHYLTQLVPGTYRLHFPAQEQFVQRPAFWKPLSDAGRRVAILDVPLTRLDSSLLGIQVVEWGGHDAVYGFSTHPAELATQILGRHGAHPVGSTCDADGRTATDYADFVSRLERGAQRKAELTCELLRHGEWDLLMQVFTEAHCSGHQCWHLHESTHPAHDPVIASAVGDPLRRVYRAVDAAVGQVVEAAGEAAVVVFSAHGMSHWYGAQFLLRDILVRLGATAPRPAPAPTLRSVSRSIALHAWRNLPESARAIVRRTRRALPSRATQPDAPSIDADLTRSRCFVHPNGLAVGGIRLNIAGREPAGLLQPGVETDTFVTWLSDALREIVDERTGKPLVSRVVRTASLYAGEHLDILPDLLVEWSDAAPTGSTGIANGIGAHVRVTSPRIGVVEGVNEYARTGEHRPGGWIVAAGPGIASGRLDADADLVDVAPTITAMLGVELAGCDGRPIERISASKPVPRGNDE